MIVRNLFRIHAVIENLSRPETSRSGIKEWQSTASLRADRDIDSKSMTCTATAHPCLARWHHLDSRLAVHNNRRGPRVCANCSERGKGILQAFRKCSRVRCCEVVAVPIYQDISHYGSARLPRTHVVVEVNHCDTFKALSSLQLG